MNRRRVLIETSWNVKGVGGSSVGVGIGINRNIVECKGIRRNDPLEWSKSINRNIVECKGGRSFQTICELVCINRNIVECKVRMYFLFLSDTQY